MKEDKCILKFKNNCIICKKEFSSRYGTSKYCSNKCNMRGYRNKKIKQDTNIYNYNCPECNKGFDKYVSLRKHRSRAHKIPSKQTYILFKLNGIIPLCKCGCGQSPKFLDEGRGFCTYITGHNSRVINNWGNNPNFKEIKRKSADTQKKMFASGELKAWNKGLTKETSESIRIGTEKMNTPERARKLSKALTGVKKSPEHVEKLKKGLKLYWSVQERRDEQRGKRIKWFKTKQHKNKSNLEKEFENILISLEIKFENQYNLNNSLFDFYIPNKNILIEVDGDWYHCNPDVHPEPKYGIQRKTLSNDKYKNRLCQKNNIKLLRFWENDINNNRITVIEQLTKELK